MNWYLLFGLSVFAICLLATPADRNAAVIVLMATVLSHITVLALRHVHVAEKLIVPGLVETITILAIARYAPGASGRWQIGALMIAWLTHLLCYIDIKFKTNLVYDSYESILGVVAVAQVAGFWDTFRHTFCQISAYLGDRSRDIRNATLGHDLLPRNDGVGMDKTKAP